MGKSWKWGAEVGGHYWRTAADIMNDWKNVLHNFDTAYSIPSIETKTVPGHYTFLDQMVVGVAPNGTGDRSAHGPKGGVPGPGLSPSETVRASATILQRDAPRNDPADRHAPCCRL